MRIVETDNYGGDYPNEKFLLWYNIKEEHAQKICDAINEAAGENSRRFWKVVEEDYKLIPGFEP